VVNNNWAVRHGAADTVRRRELAAHAEAHHREWTVFIVDAVDLGEQLVPVAKSCCSSNVRTSALTVDVDGVSEEVIPGNASQRITREAGNLLDVSRPACAVEQPVRQDAGRPERVPDGLEGDPGLAPCNIRI
jgi:hypothetical protein